MYYAHTGNDGGFWEPVGAHLSETAKLAGQFASIWGRSEEGTAAGLFHDFGKYTELFQAVLKGKAQHVDHSTPGAAALLMHYRAIGMAAALAIQGHHEGLQIGRHRDLGEILKMKEPISPQNKTYSCRDIGVLLKHFGKDDLELPEKITSDYPAEYAANRPVAAMLYTRMLFSSLVDADFLATEAHFSGNKKGGYKYRHSGQKLEPDNLLITLLTYMEKIRCSSTADEELNSLRDDLFNACLTGGKKPQGIYTLTAPTGAGKTLATLAFALQHAAKHQLRRIIFVMPYLNIIEQNALVYKKVFENLETALILEDHSQAELPEEQRLLAENWDAPIIVTTTIRFFEGLFANRSSPCRRLHNIANSVILFDEAQSLPPSLAIYTLAALSYLVERFACTAVFSTATQPTFEIFNDQVKKHTTVGWQPPELIPKELNLFKRTRAIRINWRGHQPWQETAREIAIQPRILAVVNTRKQARTLYQCVKEQLGSDEKLFFLSTDMCPAHRLAVIREIKELIAQTGTVNPSTCRLISTQCVEAGVDLDFPVVWRALAPMESIIQAAGRCNRQGLLPFGRVVVFRPPEEDERFPDPSYEKGALEVQIMREQCGELDLGDPEVIKDYYRRYFLDNLHRFNKADLSKALQEYDFLKVAREYRWIKDASINILAPYAEYIADYDELVAQAASGHFNRSWIKKARPISVGYRIGYQDDMLNHLEAIESRQGEATGWYILKNHDLYSDKLGLIAPTEDQHIGNYIC